MMDKNPLKKQFAVYDFDTTVTLKQGESHSIWYELVLVLDTKQSINHARLQILP